MKAKTRHFPITDFGGRGGLNVPFNLSKIVDSLLITALKVCFTDKKCIHHEGVSLYLDKQPSLAIFPMVLHNML